MCSFTVLGGGGPKTSISIWCDHHLPSPSHRAMFLNSSPGDPLLCIFCMSPLFNTPDWAHQLIRRETWTELTSWWSQSGVLNKGDMQNVQSRGSPGLELRTTHIELIRMLIVACGMLVHSSSMIVRSCWILAGTGTRCRIHRSRTSQTCSMGDMSGEYAGHARTGMFSASRNCVQILATWGRALSCWNMRW